MEKGSNWYGTANAGSRFIGNKRGVEGALNQERTEANRYIVMIGRRSVHMRENSADIGIVERKMNKHRKQRRWMNGRMDAFLRDNYERIGCFQNVQRGGAAVFCTWHRGGILVVFAITGVLACKRDRIKFAGAVVIHNAYTACGNKQRQCHEAGQYGAKNHHGFKLRGFFRLSQEYFVAQKKLSKWQARLGAALPTWKVFRFR